MSTPSQSNSRTDESTKHQGPTSPKLTYLINKIDYGGAEVGLVRLLSELTTDDFDVTVVTLKHVNPDLTTNIPDHVTIREIGMGAGISVSEALAAVKRIRRSDVLVSSLLPSIVVGTTLGTMLRVPEIYTWRHTTHRENRFRRALYTLSYRLSDGIFVDSDASKQHIVGWGIDENLIHKLPLSGIIVDEFPVAEHNEGTDPIRVGTVGRLIEKKGLDELIECAEVLPDLEFHIVGDGPLLEQMQEARENVVCHGRVSQEELHHLWGTFDIYFQPSRYEGLCITAIEGMAAGLPIVASDIDGLSESVIDGETGFLVPQGDVESYCERLRLLAGDADVREQMGRTGRERVSQEFSSEALARKFLVATKR